MARGDGGLGGGIGSDPAPRRASPRFWLSIRDRKIGDSLTLSLTPLPWRGRFISTDGQELSTAQICRALAATLNHD